MAEKNILDAFKEDQTVEKIDTTRKLKVGIIGCGGIADRRTLPGMMLAENAELVAVMEVNQELADSLKEKGYQVVGTTLELFNGSSCKQKLQTS